MRILGYRLVRDARYQDLLRAEAVRQRAAHAYRWFSGWLDLDILWQFIFTGTQGVSDARDAYARARGTDCYGQARPAPTPRERDTGPIDPFRDAPG